MEDVHPPESAANGGDAAETLGPAPSSKRQRRPSVRLGEIGDQPAAITSDLSLRRHPKSHHSKPSSRIRHLTTFVSSGDDAAADDDRVLLPVDENLDPLSGAATSRRGARDPKPWRWRSRSSWIAPRAEEIAELKSSGGEEAADEGYDEEDSGARVRVSESRDTGPAAVDGDETDGREWSNRNGRCRSVEDGGVKSWLNELGLGRYAPVFEIHEVDDEVLPLLTLEDLKDMGINAVGSRRKMYCSIQKRRKNQT
ncbi:uncharacterized protein [Typha latifolia]|uniref:uncharacterized protein n=1 Tax=Typha latifolia TaxID=4733 RepID=UPI003C2D1D75